MKIALVALNGSFSHTNLAIRCLRDALEQKGFPVTLSEHTVKDRTAHVLEALYRIDADVYGFSCYVWNIEGMLSLAESLHALLPKARIVLGGPEASYAVERFTDLSYVDAVVCGEGETVMTELCSLWREGKEAARVLYGLPADNDLPSGILYRTDESTGRLLYYESSRGCPYNCAYCLSSATRGVRMKSVEQTLSELEAFEHLPGKGQIIKLVDRTFNADVKRANAIWRALLEDRFTKTYHFEICATLLDEESFAILSRFPKGKIQLECGLQSTDPETLAAVSRHVDPVRVLENVRRIHRMGNIHVHLDLIAGLPYEDYDRFARSFDDAYGSSDMLQLGFLKLQLFADAVIGVCQDAQHVGRPLLDADLSIARVEKGIQTSPRTLELFHGKGRTVLQKLTKGILHGSTVLQDHAGRKIGLLDSLHHRKEGIRKPFCITSAHGKIGLACGTEDDLTRDGGRKS